MVISKEDRALFEQRLPHGAKTEIARGCSVNRAAVTIWFKGKSNSCRIQAAVLAYMEHILKIDTRDSKRTDAIRAKL